jgi:hypothetical protein
VAEVTKCVVAANICISSEWNLIRDTIVVPRIYNFEMASTFLGNLDTPVLRDPKILKSVGSKLPTGLVNGSGARDGPG